jgi:hypothetical protein
LAEEGRRISAATDAAGLDPDQLSSETGTGESREEAKSLLA